MNVTVYTRWPGHLDTVMMTATPPHPTHTHDTHTRQNYLLLEMQISWKVSTVGDPPNLPMVVSQPYM